MKNETQDRNYVSLSFWLFALLIMAFPVVNILMTFYWAFSGDNESRKNYFKAMILAWLIIISLFIAFALLFVLPRKQM